MNLKCYILTVGFLINIFLSTFIAVQGQTTPNFSNEKEESIRIDAPELKNLNFNLSTGGLKIVTGPEGTI